MFQLMTRMSHYDLNRDLMLVHRVPRPHADGGGYDIEALRANCMGDSLLAVVDTSDRGVCHLGNRTCFSQPVG
jgi:hypothetical protein